VIVDQFDQQYIVDLQDNNGYNHLALVAVNYTFEVDQMYAPGPSQFLTQGNWEVTDFVGYSPITQEL